MDLQLYPFKCLAKIYSLMCLIMQQLQCFVSSGKKMIWAHAFLMHRIHFGQNKIEFEDNLAFPPVSVLLGQSNAPLAG